jgi:hypothetical protein
MSSPTPPGYDPNHPQWNAPQGQPGWNAPQGPPQGPQQGYGGPAPAYSGPMGPGGTGQRPGAVTAAGVIGIVWGSLVTLLLLLALLGASVADDFGVELSALDIIATVVGLAAAVALLVGGIQVLQGKAPTVLLYGAYATLALWVLGVVVGLAQGRGFSPFSLLELVIAGAIVALLMQPQAKQYFAARGQGS